jgi:hypothetical protein
VAQQQRLGQRLGTYGRVHLISRHNPLTLAPGDVTTIRIVITTPQHGEGYTLSLLHVGLTGCWLSNEATREQLVARLNRPNQQHVVQWITVHCGILSYIFQRYERTRNLAEAVRELASEIPEILRTDLGA